MSPPLRAPPPQQSLEHALAGFMMAWLNNEPDPNNEEAIRTERMRRLRSPSCYRRPNETTNAPRTDLVLSDHGNDGESFLSLSLNLPTSPPPPPPHFLGPIMADLTMATMITGEVRCRNCKESYTVSYNLMEKFREVKMIFQNGKRRMRERAPEAWTDPELGSCVLCGHGKALKPVIARRESDINWLFLLLGQTLGHCTVKQLRYFCEEATSHHSTGAKDRVLYLTYVGLCKMLEPENALFDF